MLPSRRANLTTRNVDGELIIVDREAQKVHRLNGTATFVWNECDGKTTPAEMAARLAQDHGIDAEAILPDVTAAIASFRELGLLAAD